MDLTFNQILILSGVMGGFIILIAALILVGVCLGAYFVFRTKREPHESITGNSSKGSVFSLGDELEAEPEEELKLPDSIMERFNAFKKQTGTDDA